MKKFSIILNVILLVVAVFFIVFANIQTSLAVEYKTQAETLAQESVALMEKAQMEAANARKAEANALFALTQAEEIKLELDKCLGK